MDTEKMFNAMFEQRTSMGHEPCDMRGCHESKCSLFDGRDCDCDGYYIFTFLDECWRVLSSGEIIKEEQPIWYMEHQGPPGVCSAPDCGCGAHGAKYMHAECHPASGLCVAFDDMGTLTISCKECEKVLRRFAVAFLDNG